MFSARPRTPWIEFEPELSENPIEPRVNADLVGRTASYGDSEPQSIGFAVKPPEDDTLGFRMSEGGTIDSAKTASVIGFSVFRVGILSRAARKPSLVLFFFQLAVSKRFICAHLE